jgi:hypothetical protein
MLPLIKDGSHTNHFNEYYNSLGQLKRAKGKGERRKGVGL